MIFAVIFLLIGFAGSASIMYFCNLYTQWYWYWIPLVMIPVSYVLLYGLCLLILFPFSKMVDIDKEVKKPSRFAAFIVRQFDFLTIQLSNTKVKYNGFKQLNKKAEYMIIYNHISNFDPMILMSKIKRLICITKRGNKKIPIVGGMIHKAGYITIDRENNEEGIKAINKAIDTIVEHKASICVSPEGTRSKDLTLLPFHPGTFQIAKRSGAPIICVAVRNTNLIHKNFPFKRTKVYCDIIYTMSAEEYADISTVEIANRLHAIYEEKLGR